MLQPIASMCSKHEGKYGWALMQACTSLWNSGAYCLWVKLQDRTRRLSGMQYSSECRGLI